LIEFSAMNSTIRLCGIEASFQERVQSLFLQFEQTASRFLPDNPLADLNHSPLDVPVYLEETLAELLWKSIVLSRKVNYVIHPFIGDVMKSIGYTSSFSSDFNPKMDGIQSQQASFWEEPIEKIASRWIIKKRNFSFDFGGFGKGYIVDKAINLLHKENVKDALVNAGGDLYAIGRHQVGIEHPLLKGKDMLRFYIEDNSLATSGKNLRTWSSKGKRYHHIVNGRTGAVANNGVLQASAIASTVMEAETISKVFCILPFKEAKALVTKQFSNFAYFIYFDNSQMAVGGNSTLYSDLEVAI